MGTGIPLFSAISVLICLAGAQASAQCRQALALGLDVSGSVDSREYNLQIQGLANALRHPDVTAALLSIPDAPVRIAVFEWSGPGYQRLVLDWTTISNSRTLNMAVAKLAATTRHTAPPVTALGRAMLFGKSLLDRQPDCWKRTLDISGDGKNNTGPNPGDLHALLDQNNMTLNALVIGSDQIQGDDHRQVQISELSAYFRARVIHGPDAFVETALGFQDYETAMVRKLLREIQGLALSAVSPMAPEPAQVRP